MAEKGKFKPKKSVALLGEAAANTALASVGKSGDDLHYRGYDILDLAEISDVEEVAYLLIYEKLPTKAKLKNYKNKIRSYRGLPQNLKEVLKQIPAAAHPMDVLRTSTSVLGTLLPEREDQNTPEARDIADRLLASF